MSAGSDAVAVAAKEFSEECRHLEMAEDQAANKRAELAAWEDAVVQRREKMLATRARMIELALAAPVLS